MQTYHARGIRGLSGLARWARNLPLFDSADRTGSGVEIIYDGRAIAAIKCASAELAAGTEMICERVVLDREDGMSPMAFPPRQRPRNVAVRPAYGPT